MQQPTGAAKRAAPSHTSTLQTPPPRISVPTARAAAQGHPIHLWDACSGQLRGSYRAHDDADDPTAAYSLAFSPDGAKLVGGYPKCFRIFDVARPGRDCSKVLTQRRRKEGSMAGGRARWGGAGRGGGEQDPPARRPAILAGRRAQAPHGRRLVPRGGAAAAAAGR